jgi:hypothetical protein
MKMDTEQRIEDLERRLAALEKERCQGNGGPALVEMDLTLPKTDIDGLHFNKTEVHAVFEKKDDGWYHSRDILFLSARNIEADNSLDILTKYLQSEKFIEEMRIALSEADIIPIPFDKDKYPEIKISLSEENEGVKRYNGVNWWYWLEGKYSDSAATFCDVLHTGHTASSLASAVGGCAPMFRVKE